MTQQYTPVAWQDETTSQQGTLINAERLNQMQTAHHYADGFEEVDAVPTANPSVAYHKIVYCTADSTFYRWDGTEWTKDIDDETKALLQQEIARATEAEGELAQDLADETTARETADTAMQADITAMQSGKLDKKTTGPLQYQIYGVRGSNQIMFNTWGTSHTTVPTYGIEEDLLAKMPTYGLTDDTVVNYGWATAQIGAEATARAEADTALGGRIDTEQARAEAAEQANAQAIADTYTKAEADTLLAGKASTTAVQTLDTRVGALETGLADTYNKSQTDTLLATKLDTLSTTGLHAYTHNGATQSEVSVIDGTTASTIPIRGANGRLQAADPASGATDKTLVTANWVSQTGDNAPNNLVHKYGAETIHDDKSFTNPIKAKYFLCNRFSITPQNSHYWVKVYTYNNSGSFAVPSFSFIAVTREHSDIILGTVQLNKSGETVQSVTLKGITTDNARLKPLFVVTTESVDEFTVWYNCEYYTGGLRANVTFSLASNYAVDNVTSINGTGAAQQGYDISETGYTDENGVSHTFLAYAVMS